MTFGVTIDTGNAAFGEHIYEATPEVARILRDIADRVEGGAMSGDVRDYNGNTVGAFRFGGAV
jgi:hypothetical protein